MGKKLVKNGLEYLKKESAKSVWCNARTTAIGFYFALNFKPLGEEFEIEGIGPHYIAELIL